MAIVALCKQAFRRAPYLRGIIGPDLIRHDLVHCDVQPGVDHLAADVKVTSVIEGLSHFRMLCLDQDPALVFIGRVEHRQIDAIDLTGSGRADKAPSFGLAHSRDGSAILDQPKQRSGRCGKSVPRRISSRGAAKFTLEAGQNFGAEMARNETKQRYLAVSNGNEKWGKKGL
jgi:hypothetical protein